MAWAHSPPPTADMRTLSHGPSHAQYPTALSCVIFRICGEVFMRLRLILLALVLALSAAAQRHRIDEINSEKPDGKLLQQIMQENDAAKRVTLLEQYATQFAGNKDLPWVLE